MRLYYIYNKHTQTIVSKPYKCMKRAWRRVDRLDNEYGGYKYTVKTVEVGS